MRRTILGLIALYAIMSCTQQSNQNKGYIGRSEITLTEGQMTPESLLAFGRISDPQISPDSTCILYGVSYNSIKDNRSCRNLYIINIDGSGNRQLTRSSKSISNARWSKDGSTIYFLQEGQIWKAPYKSGRLGKKTKLSQVPKGISEFKLSPDQSSLIYTSSIKNQLVQSPADSDPSLDKAQAYATEDLMYRHWDHWVTETPRSYIASLDQSMITPENSIDILGDEAYELPTEPFGGVEQLSWSPDGRYIAYSCRKLMGKEYAFSTNTDIYVYDRLSGETRKISTARGYDTDPAWSPDGSALAWISMERDGYEADRQRLMISQIGASEIKASSSLDASDGFDLLFSEPKELTKDFIYDVAGFSWSANSKEIIFSFTKKAVDVIASVGIDGRSAVKELTPDTWRYGFSAPFFMDLKGSDFCLYTCYQSMQFPIELACISSHNGDIEIKAITTENKHILDQIAPIREEQIVLKTPQGEDLYCWVLYPPHFDPAKKWSAVEMFNGGPQSSLDQHWSYRWNFMLMAQKGYVVLLPNRHGDSGFGQAWKEQISGDYQGLNMEDYQIAGRWFKNQPWAGKLAGVGASYGGFSVYNMMGIHGDLYDCFISHAGIFDEKIMWYTTEEAWFPNWDNGGLKEYAYEPGKIGPAGDGITFGGMQQAGAPYAKGAKVAEHYGNDPTAKVCNWHTPILCIHGMLDFRIPYTQGMAAFAAAQMMGVPSKLIIFPEENHWILQPQNSLYWHREFYAWLERWI